MKKPTLYTIIVLTLVSLGGCDNKPSVAAGDATPATAAVIQASIKGLDLSDTRDMEDAQRGFIARPSGKILGADGNVLIDFDAYRFVEGKAPATVNPSLWRHAMLNAQIGLFKVREGIYQLRGFDIANMTLIDGQTGWIVVDPLTSRESAAAALAFAREHLGNKAVTAIIFTHDHADHFGGVLGITSSSEVAQRNIPIVAPAGFMEEATSENVLAGPAMARRSMYQFGKNLTPGATGIIDTGLGKNVAYGSMGILPPTQIIDQPIQPLVLDGVSFVFHNMPGAEAPAELTFSIPALKAYGGAELLTQTMHNLLPIRGAKVRDALRWSDYMQIALDELGDTEVYFGQHNWPIWGNERIREFITKHRDVYKYLHDQTVRLMNAGYTPNEIADKIQLPDSLASYFGTRGYYGDLRHNVKAIYQLYLGAYDGNPAHLNPLVPKESAKRYVELMGGNAKVLEAARVAYDKGEYRWVAELLDQAVLAKPDDTAAKELLARAFEQMGYQAESATWRNSYLTAAMELRNGPPTKGVKRSDLIELMKQTPTERFLEAMAASLDGPAADGKRWTFNLLLTDTHESFVLWIENAVLHYRKGPTAANANATLALTKDLFVQLLGGTAGLKEALTSDDLKVDGNKVDLVRFLGLLEKAPGNFAIVARTGN